MFIISDLISNVAEHEKQSKCQSKYRYSLFHKFIKVVQTYLIGE